MSSDKKIPLWMREYVSRICKIQPMQMLGRVTYAWIAKYCADRIGRFSIVESVYLRGRGISQCDPGISDLDFWAFFPEIELNCPNRLLEFRQLYRRLQKRFIVPGKIEVTSSAAWALYQKIAPAWLLEDLPLRLLTGIHEAFTIDGARSQVRLLSKFNLAMYNYSQAQNALSQMNAGENKYYCSALFKKYTTKIWRLASLDGDAATYEPLTPKKDCSKTLVRLHSFAEHALTLSRISKTTKANVPKFAHEDSDVGHSIRRLCEAMQKNGFEVCSVGKGKYLLWSPASLDERTAQAFFERLEIEAALLAGESKGEVMWPPPVISPPMLRALCAGSLPGPLLEDLELPDQSHRGNDLDREIFDSLLLSYFLGRLVTRLNHNLGVVVTYETEHFATPLLFQCFELLIVQSKLVTNDYERLCELNREACPFSVYWFERLLQKENPTTESEWIAAYVNVRKESFGVIERFQSKLCDSADSATL